MEVDGICYQSEQKELRLAITTVKYFAHCAKCKKTIDYGVEYKNEVWHRECFTCANCPQPLAGAKFVCENDNPYCFRCFGQLFAHQCVSCKAPILCFGDGFLIRMAEGHWHVRCFNCVECRKHLLGELSIFKTDGLYCINCERRPSS